MRNRPSCRVIPSRLPDGPTAVTQIFSSGVAPPPAARLVLAAVPRRQGGRISGRVTDRRGHPLAGICVVAFRYHGFGFTRTRTGARGYYTTAPVPPGRYVALFYAGCGNPGNWLSQVYKNTGDLLKPTLIPVRPGQTTPGVNAVLRPGGEISGTVTNAAGQKLSGICAAPVAASNGPQYLLILPGVSRAGAFHVRGVPAGT